MLKKSLIRADNVNTDVAYSLIFQCVITICKTIKDIELFDLCSEIVKKLLNENSKPDQVYIGL